MARDKGDYQGPRRIQRKRTKGWRMPEGAVYVGRPTGYGNPFVGDPQAAVEAYRQWLTSDSVCVKIGPDHPISSMTYVPTWNAPEEVRRMAQTYLRGKELVCWCPLDQPCHADVLLELANPGLEP
jgi:hypothetical protein